MGRTRTGVCAVENTLTWTNSAATSPLVVVERAVATEAFAWPLGDWLVVLAGLGLIGFAVQQIYAAITCRLERDLDVAKMRREAGE